MSLSPVGDSEALIVLPQHKFEESEYLALTRCFRKYEIQFVIATATQTEATGIDGLTLVPNFTFDEIAAIDYAAICLIGGVGSIELWHNGILHDLLNEANRLGLLIGAICLAPVILANAGLLRDIKATSHKPAASYLRSKKAIYTGNDIETDGNIITACGPEAADAFAEAIVEAIQTRYYNMSSDSDTCHMDGR